MRRVRAILASLALVGAGGLAACGADGAAPTPSSTTTVTAASIPVIGGGNFDPAAFDQGPLALWFWAPG